MLIELPRWLSWKSTQPKSVVGIPPDAANFSLERKTSSGELIWSSRNHDYDPSTSTQVCIETHLHNVIYSWNFVII